ncbi:MAG: AzlD domain-containing protein [Spirochaetales bacterium]|nr:AzlD domain-containing protein [Spirochaetales bacterium]
MNNILILVFLMALVTYIPRLLPMVLLKADKLPKKLKLFLSYIPYAVLGALIIPDGLTGIPDSLWISVTVLVVAALVSWYKNNVILAFVISVAVAWGLQTF